MNEPLVDYLISVKFSAEVLAWFIIIMQISNIFCATRHFGENDVLIKMNPVYSDYLVLRYRHIRKSVNCSYNWIWLLGFLLSVMPSKELIKSFF